MANLYRLLIILFLFAAASISSVYAIMPCYDGVYSVQYNSTHTDYQGKVLAGNFPVHTVVLYNDSGEVVFDSIRNISTDKKGGYSDILDLNLDGCGELILNIYSDDYLIVNQSLPLEGTPITPSDNSKTVLLFMACLAISLYLLRGDAG